MNHNPSGRPQPSSLPDEGTTGNLLPAGGASLTAGWRTMESAPKDGQTILVYRHKTKRYPVIGVDYWSDRYTSPCWAKSYADEQPTHWMPLPAAPLPEADVAGLVERLTSLKYPQAVMDAVETLTRLAAELAAEKAEVERINKGWEESRASAADAGLALRELGAEIERWKEKYQKQCEIFDEVGSRALKAETELELTVRARDALAEAIEQAESDLTAARAQRDLAEIKRADTERMYEGALTAARARIALLTKLVERAYNEAFSEGMKEHTHSKGGKDWSESRARSLLGEQADD